MNDKTELQMIVGCQQAIHRFYAALDASKMDEVVAAMAPTGVWHRQGKTLQGPEGVLAALRVRPAGRHTAHLVQNLIIDTQSQTTACASYMTLVYRFDATDPISGPSPLGLPLSISLNKDELTLDESGNWLFLEKRSEQKFAA